MAAVTNVLALPPGNTFETALGKMLSLGKLPDLGLTWLYRFFSPANLFANSEQGAWYDPSDMSTLYQDAAGTTPVTAVEQPVGLMLDKSKGLVLGPELVVNGTFDSGTTGWTGLAATLTQSSSGVTITNTTTNGYARQYIPTTVGKRYRINVFAVDRSASAQFTVVAYDDINAEIATTGQFSTIGVKHLFFTAKAASTRIHLLNFGAAGQTVTFDNISVRELPGNHAFQTTATSRPVLSARVNLLTKTEQFDDAAWVKVGATVVANAIAAPDEATTVDTIIESSAFEQHEVLQSFTPVANVTYKAKSFVKSAGRRYAYLGLYQGAERCVVLFDLQDGAVVGGLSVEGSNTGWELEPYADGFLISVEISFTTSSTVFFVAGPSNTATPALVNGRPRYTGDGTSGIYIWGASLVPANQADLPYQRVNIATDYDSDPAKFPRYLRCDGIDDGMVTGTITPGTDKAQVFAGVRKLSDAVGGTFIELGLNAVSTNGSFGFYAPSAVRPDYGFVSRGTALANASAIFGFAAPITNTITGLGDISGDRATLRIDGAQAAQSTADQGTGNYLAYPLYLFRRGGTSLPFNGNFYGGIIRFGDNLPIETIEQTEAWMAAKTGVTL